MTLLATLPPCSLYLQGVIGELPDVELGGRLLGLGHGRVRDDDGDGVGAKGGRKGGREVRRRGQGMWLLCLECKLPLITSFSWSFLDLA
jgi:hypothetical protein